jgi:VWFA-related protein
VSLGKKTQNGTGKDARKGIDRIDLLKYESEWGSGGRFSGRRPKGPIMKNILVPLLAVLLCIPCLLCGQEAFKEISVVVNIEVPVRVYEGSRFVDDLTIDDFEVLEDGVPQKIEAVYLIKKNSIERSDENRRFSPDTQRCYFLFFEMADYSPRLEEALDFFIQNVISPQDVLFVTTPLNSYRLKDDALEMKSKAEIAEEITKLVRVEIEQGNREYRQTIRDLVELSQKLAVALGATPSQSTSAPAIGRDSANSQDDTIVLELLLLEYSDVLAKLENLRKVDQLKLLDFARYLKNQNGQKYVYMFYEKEFIPRIDSRILDQFKTSYQDNPALLQSMSTLFDFYTRQKTFDVDKVKKAYSDASTSIHFLFLTEIPEPLEGVRMEEHSEDIFSAFREMAKATGGLVIGSRNPVHAFQRTLEASENFYLLYYRPREYTQDGKFKEIEVRVKKRRYRVLHRAGYFSN